jgi:ABC-type multidrug transport system fused ATPase/permease subunit
VSPGRILGLLGRTGSGKTTITRLLFRLHDPDEGTVFVNGVDLRDMPVNVLRRRIGLVTQEVQLFRASLRDNLTLFSRNIADADLLAALESLGLANWFAALPEGLDTKLQGGSEGLSAGEAQLLDLARVFLKDPDLVILDEASARIDPATEQLLSAAIARLVADRTAIIIAHRLSTVERADDIMVMEHGGIAEFGARSELADDAGSHFHRLLETGLQDVLA